MEFLGLTAAQLLSTLGIFGGAVVALYLLKLRRRQVTVPFVKLWEQILSETQTTRLFSQLKRLLSLFLALLFVALLTFAIADPRYRGASASGRTLVVLLDASASMQATDVEPGRLEVARARAQSMIEELGPTDRMLLAQVDRTAHPISPLTADPQVLKESLERLHATDTRARLDLAINFAVDILRDQPNPELIVLSDGNVELPPDASEALARSPIRLSFVSIGESDDNVAITAFSVRRYPLDVSQSEVLVELWNPSSQSRAVELKLLGDGTPIEVQELNIAPGERVRRLFGNISGADQKLEADIGFPEGRTDALAVDNHAYALLPRRNRSRVLAVSDGNLYLQAALLLDEYLEVTEITPAQYPVEGTFDVIIFDAFVPPTPPAADAIYLYPKPEEGVLGPFQVDGEIERPVFERVERNHPLVRWTALQDVNVASALKLLPETGDRVLASDRRGPLLIAGTRGSRRIVAFTFDVRKTDLPLRVAWPVLLLNAVNWFMAANTGYVSSYRTGETWHISVEAGVHRATLVSPNGESQPVPIMEGRAVHAGTQAGFYTLRTEGSEEVFAANLESNEEADIKPVHRLTLGDRSAGEPSAGTIGVREEVWIYLVLLALLLGALEWFTYHRRWTV